LFKISSIKIGGQLLLGFAIIVLMTVGFGINALIQLNTLSNITQDMRNHPMVVSNAVRDIENNLLRIQNNLQLLIYEQDNIITQNLYDSTFRLEDKIEQDFKLINDRFLGDMGDVEKAHQTFGELSSIFDEVLILVQQENYTEASQLSLRISRLFIEQLQVQVASMSEFAARKSEDFYSRAVMQGRRVITVTLIFLGLIMIFSTLLAFYISRGVTRRLSLLINHVEKLSQGDQEEDIQTDFGDEIGLLSNTLGGLQESLREVVAHALKIADGDYSGRIKLRSEKDDLARALNQMTDALKDLKDENNYSDWLKTGQNLLNPMIGGDKELEELSCQTLSVLADHVEAQVGAFYVYFPDKKNLKMLGSYAYSSRKDVSQNFKPGEGIVGQVALERKIISITDVPEGYLPVKSGLGEESPASIIAFPLIYDNELKGVIELGRFKNWTSRDRHLFELVGESIAISINSCTTRHAMEDLLTQQRKQSRELMSQQEELKAANEELEEKTDRLVQSEERLINQQEELQATNEELEEKTESLEDQRDEINRQNRELEIVKDEIMLKAKDLESSSKYKSEFLANMSHELRTPLNSLMILARDLMNNRTGNLSDDDVKSAEIIYNSGSELLHLINEVLDLSKIESGKVDIEIREIDLNRLAEDLDSQFRSMAVDKDLEFIIELKDNLPGGIRSDRQKIGQILKNLLSNAIKFTSEGGVSLEISASHSDLKNRVESVRFSVKDSGIGIASEHQASIFEAFKQADGSTSREFGGTGLGLSISRELAEFLGGKILLESVPGKGSEFSLIIPVNLEKKLQGSEFGKKTSELQVAFGNQFLTADSTDDFVEDDRDEIELDSRCILIIEDDKVFASILRDISREEGFLTIVVPTGEAGLMMVREKKPKAVILDIKLPGISGLQVLDQLKKESSTRHIPVHVMSGDDRRLDVQDKGVIGFLQKPIEKEILKELFIDLGRIIDKKVKDLLIVEDDENLRVAIEKLIGNSDVVKTSVATAGEAVNALSTGQFDCMVLDLNLPDMSGKDLLKKIAEMDLNSVPPVIIYTGKEISYEEEFELREYASSIIIKGVNSQERLLDETALFLHRVIKELPEKKQEMISRVYDEEAIFRGKRVLVVDDDMRNVYALSRILEDRGMSVEKAVNGRKAVDFLAGREKEIDIVLMDIMMPVMDGYEAMAEIRKFPEFDSLPILALTAKAMKDDRHKCLEAGANDYITKPVDQNRLLSLMRVWLYK